MQQRLHIRVNHIETVFEDDARFHHACAANLAGFGPSLFVCGYSGRLTVIHLGR